MSKIILPLGVTHNVTVNNGTSRSFVFNADGTFSLPGNIFLGNSSNAFRAIINAGNITASDKTFSLSNRSGTIALEDTTSLIAMLPSLTGNTGKALFTDGTTVYWGNSGASGLNTLNGISVSTYNAQTFAIGTSGTSPNIVSINNNTNTHTFNIPLASTAGVTAGLLSNSDYTQIVKKDSVNTFSVGQIFNGTASLFAIPPQITTPGTNTNDVATYGQVLAARNGVGLRPPVDGLDQTNYTTALPTTATIGGVTVIGGMRFLFTNLTGSLASYNNKVYKVITASPFLWEGGNSTPTPQKDGQAGDGSPTDGDIIFIRSGTKQDQQWAFNGTSWIQYSAAQSWNFSTGLTVSGNTVSIDFGTTAGKVCQGNDSRLSDSRTPTAHQLDSATYHTISGKTPGQVLIALTATTFGFVSFSQDITISATGVATIQKINNISISELGIQQNSATLVDNTSSAALVTGCSWGVTSYRSVRIDFSISRGTGNYATGYLALIHDGTTPRITIILDDEIGTVLSPTTVLAGITFSTDITGGNMRLLYRTNSTGTAATMRFYVKAFPI